MVVQRVRVANCRDMLLAAYGCCETSLNVLHCSFLCLLSLPLLVLVCAQLFELVRLR